MRKMMIYNLLKKQWKQLQMVRQFIIQVGGNMKKFIKKVLYILNECAKQHHEFERWDVKNYKK